MNIKEKIKYISRYAADNVPFYIRKKELYCGNFDDIPVLRKKDIHDISDILSVKYIYKYHMNRLLVGFTSGTTGECTESVWDRADYNRSLMELWLLRKKYYDILPSDRLCYFYPSVSSGNKKSYISKYKCGISKLLIVNNPEEAVRIMSSFKPEWLIVQPSVMEIICNIIEKHPEAVDFEGFSDSIKYIEFTGEWLDPYIRERTEKNFKCVTADQYGLKEVNSVAFECPCGNMHVLTDNVFLETAGNDLIVTSLRNHAMPLIRYETGDQGRISYDINCTCGNKAPVLKLFNGRKCDNIILKNGEKIYAYCLLRIPVRLNAEYGNVIRRYRVVQQDYSSIVFYFVCESDIPKETVIDEVCTLAHEYLPDSVEVKVVFTDSIEDDETSGKRRQFVSIAEKRNSDDR